MSNDSDHNETAIDGTIVVRNGFGHPPTATAAKSSYIPSNKSQTKDDTIFYMDSPSQSGDSLGSPCTVNSPGLNTKCFYGSSTKKLHDLRKRHRDDIPASPSNSSQDTFRKNGGVKRRDSKLQKKMLSSKVKQACVKRKGRNGYGGVKKAKIHISGKVNDNQKTGDKELVVLGIDTAQAGQNSGGKRLATQKARKPRICRSAKNQSNPLINYDSKASSVSEFTGEPHDVQDIAEITTQIKPQEVTQREAKHSESPLFGSSMESDGSKLLKSNVNIVVKQICEKYEKLNSEKNSGDIENVSDDIENEFDDIKNESGVIVQSYLQSSREILNGKESNHEELGNESLRADLNEGIKSCFADSVNEFSEGITGKDESSEITDSDNDIDTSLCSFIDASNNSSCAPDSNGAMIRGKRAGETNSVAMMANQCEGNLNEKDDNAIEFSSPLDMNETYSEVSGTSPTSSPSEDYTNVVLHATRNTNQEKSSKYSEEKDENIVNRSTPSPDIYASSSVADSRNISKEEETSKKSTLFGYFQRKTRMTDKSSYISDGVMQFNKRNKARKEVPNDDKAEKKQFSQRPLCNTSGTIDKFAYTSPLSQENEYLPASKVCNKQVKKRTSPKYESKKMEQLYIDVGQRNFGHTSCATCGMVYTKTLEEDSLQHAKYHQKLMQKLKFKGWKSERILEEFHDGRIIQVNPDDSSLHLKKVSEVREIVDADLGFSYPAVPYTDQEKVFFFVSNKKIVGCVIAVAVDKAYPVISNNNVPTPEKKRGNPTSAWCCSSEPVHALCGISRIWVLKQARKQNVASRLVDAVRNNFIYGVMVSKDKLAFSDPTPDGRVFAEKYSGTQNILVFR